MLEIKNNFNMKTVNIWTSISNQEREIYAYLKIVQLRDAKTSRMGALK